MSNISNTSQVLAGSLDAIVDRLNGTVAKVSKLRLSLDELEAELIDIRQQCENEICVDKAGDVLMTQSRHAKTPVSLANRSKIGMSKKHNPKTNPALEIPVLSTKNQLKGHLTSPSRIPRLSLPRTSGGRGLPAGIAIEKSGNSSASYSQSRSVVAESEVQGSEVLMPSHRHTDKPPIMEQNRPSPPPRPPTNPFPFPENIDLSSYPPELKHEGDGWFVLFNPSPQVSRVLNAVNLLHVLTTEMVVYCIKFSRDGKWLAAADLRTAKIFDVKTGVETCAFDHPEDVYVWHACFSPDGKYFATGGDDKKIRIWNIAEKQIHSTFEGHQSYINSLDFSPNGQFLVSGSSDGSVRIWDVHDGASKVLTIYDHYHEHHSVWSVAISPDRRYLAMGSWDASVSILEVPTGVLVQTLRGHRHAVSSVAFTPDGKRLISGSWDGTLKCWDMSGLDIGSGAGTALTSTSSTSPSPCLMNLTGHTDRVNSVAISHDGIWVVSGSYDGKVLFWDVRTGVAQYMLAAHKDNKIIAYVDLSPVDNVLATVDGGGRTRIWSYGISG